jgi:beta-galactosidase/beta-glucuronidase
MHLREGLASYDSRLLWVSQHTVKVTVEVINDGVASAAACVAFKLLDADGAVAATGSVGTGDATIVAGGVAKLDTALQVKQPSLWTIPKPYLYTLVSTVGSCTNAGATALTTPSVLTADSSSSNGSRSRASEWDSVNTSVGFRSLLYSADQGFFMNDEHVKVRGFCDHNNFAAVGMVSHWTPSHPPIQVFISINGHPR